MQSTLMSLENFSKFMEAKFIVLDREYELFAKLITLQVLIEQLTRCDGHEGEQNSELHHLRTVTS